MSMKFAVEGCSIKNSPNNMEYITRHDSSDQFLWLCLRYEKQGRASAKSWIVVLRPHVLLSFDVLVVTKSLSSGGNYVQNNAFGSD